MNNKQIRKSLSRAVTDMTPDVLDSVLLDGEQQNQGESPTPNVWKQILLDREQQQGETEQIIQTQESIQETSQAQPQENIPMHEIVPAQKSTQVYDIVPADENSQTRGVILTQKSIGYLKTIPARLSDWTKRQQFGTKLKTFFTRLAEWAKRQQFGTKLKTFFTRLAEWAKRQQIGNKLKAFFTRLADGVKRIQFGNKLKAFFTHIADGAKKWRFDKRGFAVVGVAAVVLFVVIFPFNRVDDSIDSIIGIDVNPSVEIRTNKSEKVLSVTPLNDDAIIILEDMALENVSLDVTVNALIGSMLKHGYISEKKNSILITVENANIQKGQSLQERLMSEVSTLLNSNALEGAVIGQMISEDEILRALADQNKISIGKAALIKQLTELDARLNFADIAKLGINEINLLLGARQANLQGIILSGKANSSAYISEEQAKANAYVHAGVLEGAITSVKVEMDYDDGRMVYEVDFRTATGEYEYEIDAIQGTIISFDKESNGAQTQNPQTPQTPQHTPPTHADSYISIEEANASALFHAGLDAASVTIIRTYLDMKDDSPVYDVEFISGEYEFDYEIDAYSGVVLAYDHDIEDYPPPAPPEPQAPVTPGPEATYIGRDQAKAIALAHAGFAENEVRRLKVEVDRGDGRVSYEVKFRKDRRSYEYDIDATTGEILGVEQGN